MMINLYRCFTLSVLLNTNILLFSNARIRSRTSRRLAEAEEPQLSTEQLQLQQQLIDARANIGAAVEQLKEYGMSEEEIYDKLELMSEQDATNDVVGLEEERSSTEEHDVMLIDAPINIGEVLEQLNVVDLEEERSSTEEHDVMFIDAPINIGEVLERLNVVDLEEERSSIEEHDVMFIDAPINIGEVLEQLNVEGLEEEEEQSSVLEQLNVVDLEEEQSSVLEQLNVEGLEEEEEEEEEQSSIEELDVDDPSDVQYMTMKNAVDVATQRAQELRSKFETIQSEMRKEIDSSQEMLKELEEDIKSMENVGSTSDLESGITLLREEINGMSIAIGGDNEIGQVQTESIVSDGFSRDEVIKGLADYGLTEREAVDVIDVVQHKSHSHAKKIENKYLVMYDTIDSVNQRINELQKELNVETVAGTKQQMHYAKELINNFRGEIEKDVQKEIVEEDDIFLIKGVIQELQGNIVATELKIKEIEDDENEEVGWGQEILPEQIVGDNSEAEFEMIQVKHQAKLALSNIDNNDGA